MKQRIRGLVSLHEIPFPPASYKGKEAIVHIVRRGSRRRRRGWGVGGGDGEGPKREGEGKKKLKKRTECVVVGCLFWPTWPPELHL